MRVYPRLTRVVIKMILQKIKVFTPLSFRARMVCITPLPHVGLSKQK